MHIKPNSNRKTNGDLLKTDLEASKSWQRLQIGFAQRKSNTERDGGGGNLKSNYVHENAAHLGRDCLVNVNKRGSNYKKIILFGNDFVIIRGSVGEMWRSLSLIGSQQ